ncbi:MAG TPA: glutathione S-transferase [Beijerinckiaceae bacterium]|mgnify:CR=1 FL=1|nr:glutathione S-transferase [Beijerinckiaceae bacterium]
MKLFYSAASPFARKVWAQALENGLGDRLTVVPAAVSPVSRDKSIVDVNPSGKIPTLVTEEGEAVYDSRVICEYLDSIASGAKMFPAGRGRWKALVLQSLADEALDAALLARYETVLRPEHLRWPEWRAGQMDKITSSFDTLEQNWTGYLAGHVDIGVIAAGCLCGYLDFRFPDYDWRKDHPKVAAWYESFSTRPSMVATAPK